MVAILYLAHDLDDSAIWRRVSMLEAGGAQVTIAGFRRGTLPLPRPARVLGVTQNGRMVQRVWAVARAIMGASGNLGALPRPDIILARNLEMLAVARRAMALWRSGPAPTLAYEVLDVHRMMIGSGRRARAMRAVERALLRRAGVLVTSSPGFLRAYFTPCGQIGPATAVELVENKVNDFDLLPDAASAPPVVKPTVLTIGWFGILRCAASLGVLDTATRADPGRIRVLLAGRPALDAIPDFHAVVAANPDLEFVGPYRNPDDLPGLYGAVHLAWLVDRYDAGLNSDWLLPNRLYEGGLHGAIPLSLAGTEVARYLAGMGIGLVLPQLTAGDLAAVTGRLDEAGLARLGAAVRAVPRGAWVATRADAVDLVRALSAAATGVRPAVARPVAAMNGTGR
jgi:succinoglycan biosynthesis protein ExoL